MKLDNNNKTTDTMSSMSKRDKSIDKKEKLRLDKEKKEREKQEKKERELKEKQKKEQEKILKKTSQQQSTNILPASITSSDINKLTKQNSKDFDQTNTSKSTNGLSTSKSENVLNKLKKPTSIFSSSSSKKENQKLQSQSNLLIQQQQQQQQMLPKGRFRCQVVYLDESVKTFDLDKYAIGEDLMSMVANDLELVEKEYFSLTYRDINNMKFWLDHEKKIRSQLKGQISSQEPVFSFEVKFYPPEPGVLQEEITRYLLTLQLRHDIMDGKLPCSFVTYALLGSFTVQAEMGDYDEVATNTNNTLDAVTGFEYLDGFCFAPNQTPELLAAIADLHKGHVGQSPAEAELNFLENAVKLAMYGVDLHNAKDSDGVDILIGVSFSGLLVFRDHLRINRFAWPKILKISYKRNHFYLKLRSGEFEKYETTIGFRCPNHKSAKRLWKIAVEHHAFFRLREPETKKNSLIPTFNSKFRYTGSSTYMQARHRSIERSQPSFTRSLSKRLTQSMDRGLALQNPLDTPGSVQSAAFNHYNKMKPHLSIGTINKQHIDLRESQEELDLEQGDYDLNENVNINIPNRNYQNQPFLQSKIISDKKSPIISSNNNNNNNNNNKYINSNLNQNSVNLIVDRNVNDLGSMSIRSNESNRPMGSYSYNSNLSNNNNINTSIRSSNIEQNYKKNEQPEEYYTSVDKNFPNDENRVPSIKQPIGDTIASLSGLNKISTPLASPGLSQKPQRYVPSRQFSQDQNQNRAPSISSRSILNSTNQSIPLADLDNSDMSVFDEPKSTEAILNSAKNLSVKNEYVDNKLPPKPFNQSLNSTLFKEQTRMFDSLNKYQINRIEKTEISKSDSKDRKDNLNRNLYMNTTKLIEFEQIQNSIRSTGNNNQLIQNQTQSPNNSQRFQPNSSIRSIENQNQPPPPTVRSRQPPPIPADRSMGTNRQNDSIRYQQYMDQQQFNRLRPQIPTSNSQLASSSASSFIRNTNENSRSGSISSTPDVTRIKKTVVTNEEINHKDLLLRAIQVATDLDPNFEVDKVEISAED
ncbi:unnamed protein product [Brachionus calyciflorus]|uniref:FERM domain-containing protein n=1 Tax=Brachionus calyciflorus TaxID=104777 RepID=A0A813MSG6_9BILA|nr:unnamed protein product [Brachionus calyciflorus]